MSSQKGPGERTKYKKRRGDQLALQASLPGGRIARRAQRRLIERQQAFPGRDGFHKPGSMKGSV